MQELKESKEWTFYKCCTNIEDIMKHLSGFMFEKKKWQSDLHIFINNIFKIAIYYIVVSYLNIWYFWVTRSKYKLTWLIYLD